MRPLAEMVLLYMSKLFLLSGRFAVEQRWPDGVKGEHAHQHPAVEVFSSTHWLSQKSSSFVCGYLVFVGYRSLMSSSSPSLCPHRLGCHPSRRRTSSSIAFAAATARSDDAWRGLSAGAWVSGSSQLKALMTYHCH